MRQTVKNIVTTLTLISLSLLLCSCGFHFRNAKNFPANLKYLYLETNNPYSPLSIALRNVLHAQGVRFAKKPGQAPVTLAISNVQYTHSSPALTTTSTSVSYTYTLTVNAQLHGAKGNTIAGPSQFSDSQNLYVTNSQLFAPTATPMVNAELRRNVINEIFYWLTSYNTQETVTKSTAKKAHANQSKRP